ncbi:MAG: DNA gyrase inhibitor YacG [Bdellovibrionota bacterium]
MEKQIKCPRCKTLTVYSSENPSRPFCSERCRLIDLGDWADGKFAIPAENVTNPPEKNEENPEEDDDGEL